MAAVQFLRHRMMHDGGTDRRVVTVDDACSGEEQSQLGHSLDLGHRIGAVTMADAVVHHAVPKELDRGHPHWRLTSLLKDADALDRVRLGDLDPRYLRNAQANEMIAFAQMLFDTTDDVLPTGREYFAALWSKALSLEGLMRSENGEL